MSHPEDQPAEPLTMNTLETVMIGGGGIIGIIELSAAGPDRLEWNVAGVASLAVAALGVYLNHRRERSLPNQHVDQTASTTEYGGR
jgi:hypothetical protein